MASIRRLFGCTGGSWVLNPEDSPRLRQWDMVTLNALVFVCFISPFEVAFMETEMSFNFMFIANRLLDILFVIDLFLQFFVAYPRHGRYSQSWISSHKRIVLHYLQGWFLIDFISVLPFDLVGFLMGSYEVTNLKALRFVRLFKLLKLVRVCKGLRIVNRWQLEWGFSSRKLVLLQLMFAVILFSHWTGCLLGLMNIIQGGGCIGTVEAGPPGCSVTWMSAVLARSGIAYDKDGKLPAADAYLVSLHTALSIIVHPHSEEAYGPGENIAFCILMVLGGFIWTQIISRSTAIATSLDRHQVYFQQSMDDLNVICDAMALSDRLRRRCRVFFVMNRDESKRKTLAELQQRMSPKLQQDVAHELNRSWLLNVRYLALCSRPMLTAISHRLVANFFCQMEAFGTVFALHILTRGLASRRIGCASSPGRGYNIRILTPGAVWGEDHLILCNYKLLQDVSAIAMTFNEVLILTRVAFEELLQEHPENRYRIRTEHARLALVSGMRYLVALKRGQVGKSKPELPHLPTGPDLEGDAATEEEENQRAYRRRLHLQLHKECTDSMAINALISPDEEQIIEALSKPPEEMENSQTVSRMKVSQFSKELTLHHINHQPTQSVHESGSPGFISEHELYGQMVELEEQTGTLYENFHQLRKASAERTATIEGQQDVLCEKVKSMGVEMRSLRKGLEAQLAAIIQKIPRCPDAKGASIH